MSVEKLRGQILRLKKAIKIAKLMNEDRRRKLRWLAETMEDVLLEEEFVQGFFKSTRGGEAV